MIDWDEVCFVPRTVGNEGYPGWLTGDWDPSMYAWNGEMDQGIKPDKIAWEDSPETLKSYRSVRYTSTMRCYQDKGPETSSTTAILTTNSLIYDNLLIAAAEPLLMARIVLEFVEEIAAIMQVNVQQKKKKHNIQSEDVEDDDFDAWFVPEDLGENILSENHRSVLTGGFQRLLEHSAEV